MQKAPVAHWSPLGNLRCRSKQVPLVQLMPMRAIRSLVQIGTGGSLATAPLPRHRTYGSVSGGSLG
jgi:hypothetical protein